MYSGAWGSGGYLFTLIKFFEMLHRAKVTHVSRASLPSRTIQKKKHDDKCKTVIISNSHSTSDPAESGLIALGRKDPKNDDLIESERTKSKDKNFKNLFLLGSSDSPKETETFSANSILINNLDSKNILKEVEPQMTRETSLPLFENSEQIEDNPSRQAFMGTFGSWINDLFSGSPKTPQVSSKEYSKSYQQETDLEKDPEYFKSINALKKQFRKKLKSETSVHIAGGDKQLELDINKLCSQVKKIKRPKSQAAISRVEQNEEFFDCYDKEESLISSQGKAIRRQSGNIGSLNQEFNNGGGIFREAFQLKKSTEIKGSNIIKEIKKTKQKIRLVRDPDEYVFTVPQDLKKKLLLNISDHENCKQFYKNAPIEIQHYGQGKNKSYQSSTRCYTTNSNIGKTSGKSQSQTVISMDNKYMSSHTIASDGRKSALVKSAKKNRKTFGKNKIHSNGVLDLQRKSSSFVRVKSAKPVISIQAEPARSDPKASSDELVKYLMKKVKVHQRPQSTKKKQPNQSLIPAVFPAAKAKFMQSATTSLVMSVLSKKEADSMPGKISAIVPVNNKLIKTDFSSKPTFQPKPWNPKYSENIRSEVKRLNFQNSLNVSSYLSDENMEMDRDNYVFDKASIKNSKRIYANPKAELKDTSDRNFKRDEVRSILSNIDMRSNLYAHISRVKQNELKKRSVKNMLGNMDFDLKENQSPRFQQQHELFKTNLKNYQQNVSTDLLQEGKDRELDQSSSLPTQLMVVDDKFQLLQNETKETIKCDSHNGLEGSAPLNDKVEASELKVLECLSVDDKEINLPADKKTSIDKPLMHKDKMLKNKAMHYIKDGDKALLGPLSDYCNEKQKDQYQPSICSPDLRPVKSIETVLLNRRFSTNILSDKLKKKNRTAVSNLKAHSSSGGDKGSAPGQDHTKSDNKSGCGPEEPKGFGDPCAKKDKKNSGCPCGPKPEEKKTCGGPCGPKPEEKKTCGGPCGPKQEEKKTCGGPCGPKQEEKKTCGGPCGPKQEEKKTCGGPKPEEKKDPCGPKPEEKKDTGSACAPKQEEKKTSFCEKKVDKSKDCGFEKSQKPGPACDGDGKGK